MHLNYYFLRKLTAEIAPRLLNVQLLEAFSQDKDEIVLKFGTGQIVKFIIRALLKPDFTCLFFPDKFERARANSVDLFKELYGREVRSVNMYENERAFALQFDSSEKLVFKLFGNRSNLLYYGSDFSRPKGLFNHRLKSDFTLAETSLNRTLDQTYSRFVELDGDHRKMFPTFGPLVNSYLANRMKKELTIAEQWQKIEQVLTELKTGKYYLTSLSDVQVLSLLEIGEVQEVYSEAIDAVNAYCLYYLRTGNLQKEKAQAVKRLEKRINQTENYLVSAYEKLDQISDTGKNEQYANLLMAYLHLVEPRAEFIDVENFYTSQPVRIRLKPDLSPAKNAEAYFRKAKNEKVEITHLQKNIEAREAELTRLKGWLNDLEDLSSVKELRTYLKRNQIFGSENGDPEKSRFRKEIFMGYDIYIGKSARNNDELTLKFAGKEDLWLHAKDVSGSHVVIKNISGRKTPPAVIERAAELAAWHSKRRNDSLCPVTVTPRKFVRKAKGMAAGAVIVEKESVVMVVPRE